MKIKFKQSGGIAGVMKGCDLDTESMPPLEASELTNLISDSPIFQNDSVMPRGAGDDFQYSLEVEDKSGKKQAVLSDMALDEKSSKLIQFLKNKAGFIKQ